MEPEALSTKRFSEANMEDDKNLFKNASCVTKYKQEEVLIHPSYKSLEVRKQLRN